MTTPYLVSRPVLVGALAFLLGFCSTSRPGLAGPRPDPYWQVDDLHVGMRGIGRTVMRGTKIETFDAEVLGVLKNTSPGRDMVLCRLSGLNLEKTGVIAGMSGSPVYIEGRLLGAVAFAWAFGKEPIAGVTPFSQMRSYVESHEHRDLVDRRASRPISLPTPLTADGMHFESVTVSEDVREVIPTPDSFCMVPIKTPVTASGFTPHALELLNDRLRGKSCFAMPGGSVVPRVAEMEMAAPLQPGSPLVVALITGDFDLSGIGTVTQIEGDRVYGWGHPFFGLGDCDFPMLTGYIHAVYPRQSVSFKLGSPLKTVGVVNADVSTCIAGLLDRKPDLLPVRMTLTRESDRNPHTFHVDVARQRSLVAALVYAALTNSVDMEGDLPEELTAELRARLDVEGHSPIQIHDTFSGSTYSGGRAPQALYNQIAGVVNILTYNRYKPVRINRIECDTHIVSGRRTADIDAVELNSDTYAPGERVTASVFLRPYKGLRQRISVCLPLPRDLPEGTYLATVCDDLTNARQEIRDNPNLADPQDLEQVFEALHVQTSVKRTNLVMRIPTSAVGVALEGKSLPNLPPSMVQILAASRRTGVQTMQGALVVRRPTDWVVQGCESVRFTVAKNKKLFSEE